MSHACIKTHQAAVNSHVTPVMAALSRAYLWNLLLAEKDTWFGVMSHSQGWPMNDDWVMNQDQGPALSSKRLLLFTPSVVSDSLQPHGPQPPRLLCLPLFPRVCSNSCPLSW